MYVVVEGIDGAGKSTVCKAVADAVRGVVLHREPSSGPIGAHIRALIEDRSPTSVAADHRTMAGLFLADRASCLPQALAGLPEEGILLSDRNWLSTAAYNGSPDGKRGYSFAEIWAMHDFLPKPDLVLYLDCPVQVAVRRLQQSRASADWFESTQYLEGVRSRYRVALDLVAKSGVPVTHVNAALSVETVCAEAIRLVSTHAPG